MSKKPDQFDVAIVGAGPAGAAAAVKLAGGGHRVALIDAADYPRKVVCAGWLSARAMPMLADMGVSVKNIAADAFELVTFYNADLTKSARPSFAGAPGFLLDRSRFDHELVKTAVKAGATFLHGRHVADVILEEELVRVQIENAESISSRLLVVASGRGTPLLDRLGFGLGSLPIGYWAAQVWADGIAAKGEASVSVILGLDRAGGFGIVAVADPLRGGGSLRGAVGVQSPGDKADVIPNLVTLCRTLHQAKILDKDLSRQAADAEVMVNPAAVALSMDTHVAKHTLIVGDAGGFVSAAGGEGIYPAMWSAVIAAEVIAEALRAASPQDTLREFDARWRTTLADYLRAPNTDTQYLLPLIFSNQPMADRMGAVFFSGDNI